MSVSTPFTFLTLMIFSIPRGIQSPYIYVSHSVMFSIPRGMQPVTRISPHIIFLRWGYQAPFPVRPPFLRVSPHVYYPSLGVSSIPLSGSYWSSSSCASVIIPRGIQPHLIPCYFLSLGVSSPSVVRTGPPPAVLQSRPCRRVAARLL